MENLLLYMVEMSISYESRIEQCGTSFVEKQWMLYVHDPTFFIFNESDLRVLKVLVSERNYHETDKIADIRFRWLFQNTIGI